MWYSWSGMRQPQEKLSDCPPNQPPPKQRIPTRFAQCLPTLLERQQLSAWEDVAYNFPRGEEGHLLWTAYLQNVHPLVKIFFDWETEPTVQKALVDPFQLSDGERALVAAIYFIATLSLPLQEDGSLASSNHTKLLEQRQRTVEDTLSDAGLITTSDKRVLQAFILYMVCNICESS